MAAFGILGFTIWLLLTNNTTTGLKQTPRFQMLKPYNQDTSLLSSINDNIATQIPLGLQDTRQINVTDGIFELFTQGGDKVDWTSVQICNNGPDNVYYDINDWTNPEAPLVPAQCQTIDFRRRGAIHKIYFKCNSGNTASVSVYGVE